jgi:hypothetical protein
MTDVGVKLLYKDIMDGRMDGRSYPLAIEHVCVKTELYVQIWFYILPMLIL